MEDEHFDRLARDMAKGLKPWAALKAFVGTSWRRLVGAAAEVCGNDTPSTDSLAAARAALTSGADEVALSPGGCVRYRRTRAGGQTTYEEITAGGRVGLTWNHSGQESTGQRDADADGFFEWRATVRRGPALSDVRTEITRYSPGSKALTNRETCTRPSDATLQVQREEADPSGALRIVEQFVSDDEGFEHAAGAPAGMPGPNPPAGCTPQQLQMLQERLEHGVGHGLTCLHELKQDDLWLDLLFHYAARDIRLVCAPIPGPGGMKVNGEAYYDPSVPVVITVDMAKLPSDLEEVAAGLLHEMFHLHFGPHKRGSKSWPRFREIDPTQACEDLCFVKEGVTKCACARCLGTNICDPRCAIFEDCDPALGATCPCPRGANAYKFFPTCRECLVKCPSGLACFGFSSCIPLDVGCKRATCP
jgi:hypothetical protein